MAVAFTSNGYDSTATNPYTEASWADAHPSIGLASYGVRGPADWKVSAVSGQDRTVSIAAGKGFGHGVTDKTVANDTIQLDTIASGSRWDLIACRRDWTPTAGVSQFVKVNGGATQVIPGGRLSNPGGIDDQPLALVQVTAGQTQPSAIIDLRTWSGDGGGLLANHDLVKSYMSAVGTRLHIAGADWVRRVGANDVAEWVGVSESVTAYSFIDNQPNYNFQGTANVTTLRDGRKRVDIDLTMVRVNASNSVSNTRQDMGVVLPSAAVGAGNTKILACPFSITTGLVFVQIRPSTGVLSFWSQSALTWAENDFVSLNFSYYI